MPFSLQTFDLGDMLRCGLQARRACEGAGSMEEAAQALVRYFREEAVGADGQPECALVRFYKTHPYGILEPEQQAFAQRAMGERQPWDEMKCLVLLATAGDQPQWNARRSSSGHQAIPLPSAQIVEQAPMIAELIRQMGLDIESVVSPRPELLRGVEGKTYNVFYVPEALGSPYIPAQDDFVRPHRIRSVVGFGGLLSGGELFAVILFSRVEVPQESAARFRNIALDLKLAVSAFGPDHVFAPPSLATDALRGSTDSRPAAAPPSA
ncbi:MAG: hypothetical protein JWM27_4129 [Gemmatimonadetes bacterium]|nr:hypothetical protein [Gemmatimonadota bacterium]